MYSTTVLPINSISFIEKTFHYNKLFILKNAKFPPFISILDRSFIIYSINKIKLKIKNVTECIYLCKSIISTIIIN